MAPTKRPRPTFSPPRPSKTSSISKTKPASTKHARTSDTKKRGQPSKARFASTSKPARRSSVSSDPDSSEPSMSASNSDSGAEADALSPSPSRLDASNRSLSPTHMLVEPVPLLPNSSANDSTQIPDALIHHIANAHFNDKTKTKLTKDARTLLGVYVDTFVREAVIRCAFERQEVDGGGVESGVNGKGKEDGVGTDGWLEVGDLERVGVQLVLDF